MALKVAQAAVVAVINMKEKYHLKRISKIFASLLAFILTFPLMAAILPEDRFDALIHSYQGGGMDITGPSLLIQKLINPSYSISGNYYVDTISSASIDVITSASPYKEERTEHSIGIDYLRNKSILSFHITNSEENDFKAKTFTLGVSQDMFGDLTTLSMGYSRGKDEVMRVVNTPTGKTLDTGFGTKNIDRHNFRLGLTQVLTKNMIAGLNYELITDKGFLNNPYRQVRFADGSKAFEAYPNTRSSNAVGMRLKYYLPYRAAISGEYRFFSDTWSITGNTFALGYTHPIQNKWVFDLRYRAYDQTRANFYGDVFSAPGIQTYMARDKELSTFNNQTLGFSISYDLGQHDWKLIKKGSINFAFDHMMFDYEDFRDASVTRVPIGTEPLYSFSSNVMQFYLSVYY